MQTNCFTSESVISGHPDKACGQITDRILDRLLAQNSLPGTACDVTTDSDLILR